MRIILLTITFLFFSISLVGQNYDLGLTDSLDLYYQNDLEKQYCLDSLNLNKYENKETSLEELSIQILSFSISWVLLAFFIAIILASLHSFGLRKYLQRRWVEEWVYKQSNLILNFQIFNTRQENQIDKSMNKSNVIIKEILHELNFIPYKKDDSSFYSLSYAKLCQQVSNKIKSILSFRQEKITFKNEFRSNIILYTFGSYNVVRKYLDSLKFSTYLENEDETQYLLVDETDNSINDLQLFLRRKWSRTHYVLSLIIAFVIIYSLELSTSPSYLSNKEIVTYTLLIISLMLSAPLAYSIILPKFRN